LGCRHDIVDRRALLALEERDYEGLFRSGPRCSFRVRVLLRRRLRLGGEARARSPAPSSATVFVCTLDGRARLSFGVRLDAECPAPGGRDDQRKGLALVISAPNRNSGPRHDFID
jgi:hypothetical protein